MAQNGLPQISIRNLNYIQNAKIQNGRGSFDGYKLAEAFDDMNAGVGQLANRLATDPNGNDISPSPVAGVAAQHLGNGLVDVAIADAGAIQNAISYHLEYDTSPNFNVNPRYHFMGPSRNATLSLPNGTYYVKAYSQYQYGGSPSAAKVSSAVVVTGSASGTLLKTQGSGTGLPGQTGVGFGTIVKRTAAASANSLPVPKSAAAQLGGQPTVSSSGGGAIPIVASPSPGDGLIHGDAIWEIDPAYVVLRDDFLTLSPQTPTSGGIFISEEEWFFVSSGTQALVEGAPPYLGKVGLWNNGTANNSSFIVLSRYNGNFTNNSGGWALLDYPPWKIVIEFQLQRGGALIPSNIVPAFSMTKVSTYIGLANWQPNTPLVIGQQPRPPIFCGLRFDTDPTVPAISDTQFVFEAVCNSTSLVTTARKNTQGNTFATGIVPAEFVPYRLEILCTTVGRVTMTLSGGGTTVSSTLSVPQFTCSPQNEYMSQNGYGSINFNSIGGSPCAPGSLVTCAGFPAAFNGVKTAITTSSGAAWFNFLLAGTVGQSVANPSTTTLNPGLFPFIAIGNSSEASPVAAQNGIVLDFISLVWNPGVGGGTRTPDETKARYF